MPGILKEKCAKKMSFKCEECEKSFDNEKALIAHREARVLTKDVCKDPTTENPFSLLPQCENCHKFAPNEWSFREHQKLCKKFIVRSESASISTKQQKAIETGPKCGLCHNSFSTRRELFQHLKVGCHKVKNEKYSFVQEVSRAPTRTQPQNPVIGQRIVNIRQSCNGDPVPPKTKTSFQCKGTVRKPKQRLRLPWETVVALGKKNESSKSDLHELKTGPEYGSVFICPTDLQFAANKLKVMSTAEKTCEFSEKEPDAGVDTEYLSSIEGSDDEDWSTLINMV